MPTLDTLPAATMRGSSHSLPSGLRPLAGLSTPSASRPAPGSADMTTPRRVSRKGTVAVTVCGTVSPSQQSRY
jgi:hypothetical protein